MLAIHTIVQKLDWGWSCTANIVATSKCEPNCINELNDLQRKAVWHKAPDAGTLLDSNLRKPLCVHYVVQHGNQLKRMA